MPEFPDVVRAPPERVWRAIVDPAERVRGGSFIVEAAMEGGQAGEVDSVALYRTAKTAWRERVLEVDAPQRLLVEERDAATDRTRATMAWKITPIKMGSLVVLEVHGKGVADSARVRVLEKSRYRHLVETVKLACEGSPPVRFVRPPRKGFPFLRRKVAPATTAAPEPSALPASPPELPSPPDAVSPEAPPPAGKPSPKPQAAAHKAPAKRKTKK